MPITIGSNIVSLKTQRQLTKASNELSSVYERLSSGQRINKASDDAAGLSIAESLKSDSRVFTQGVRNFNDGISLLNVADSAIESMSSIVTRLKELAVQASNGTYSSVQRAALNKEAQALSDEYLRITQGTSFNGIKLFDGSLGYGVRLQGGYGQNGSILAGVAGAIGTATFNSATLLSLNNVAAVVSGDFNGDGEVDFISADSSSLSFSSGNGNGTFRTSSTFSTGTEFSGLVAGDVNGDGKLDVVAASYANDLFAVYLGNGNGSFMSAATYSSTNVSKVALGDFDGDGAIDIAAGQGFASTRVVIFKNSGSGTFTSSASFSGGVGIVSDVGTADLNNDGLDDVYAVGTGGPIVYTSNGNGSFTQKLSGAGTFGTAIRHGDFDGDGKIDLVTNSLTSHEFFVLKGAGDGSFSVSTTMTGSALGFPYSIETGDLNGDGRDDIVAGDYTGGESSVSIFVSKGEMSFSPRQITTVSSDTIDHELVDLNNDGVLDILTANKGGAMAVAIGSTKEGAHSLNDFNLRNASEAKEAMLIFDSKLKQLSLQRGIIGSHLSRIEVGMNNLQSASENYAAAESRIKDADIAEEAANLVRLQILQSASSSVLAQANLQPQLALRLLRGDGN